MSDFSVISLIDIEVNIVSILYCNKDVEFSQFALFDKLLKDKYEDEYNNGIHNTFKAKFLLVLRNLRYKYDDIDIYVNDNNIYFIKCISSNNIKINIEEECVKNIIDVQNISNNVNENNYLLDYIIENKLINEFEYINPLNGNTIYHELVFHCNISQISKMLNNDTFNFIVLNKNKKTPMEISNNLETSNLLIGGIMNKYLKCIEEYNKGQDKINVLSGKIEYLESHTNNIKIIEKCSLFGIIKIKSKKLYYDYKIFIIGMVFMLFLKMFIF